MDLELGTFEFENDLNIGTLQIEQIENGTKVIVELFPENQSKESFESAEFSKVYDILELGVKHGYNLDFPMPDNATEDDLTELSMAVFGAVRDMLATIRNLEDFKGVKVNFCNEEIEVYPVLERLRRHYLETEIGSFIVYRASQIAKNFELKEGLSMDELEKIYKFIDTIGETDEVRIKNITSMKTTLEK